MIYPRFMKNKTTTRRVERLQRITDPSRCRFRLGSVTAALGGMQTQSRPEPFFCALQRTTPVVSQGMNARTFSVAATSSVYCKKHLRVIKIGGYG